MPGRFLESALNSVRQAHQQEKLPKRALGDDRHEAVRGEGLREADLRRVRLTDPRRRSPPPSPSAADVIDRQRRSAMPIRTVPDGRLKYVLVIFLNYRSSSGYTSFTRYIARRSCSFFLQKKFLKTVSQNYFGDGNIYL